MCSLRCWFLAASRLVARFACFARFARWRRALPLLSQIWSLSASQIVSVLICFAREACLRSLHQPIHAQKFLRRGGAGSSTGRASYNTYFGSLLHQTMLCTQNTIHIVPCLGRKEGKSIHACSLLLCRSANTSRTLQYFSKL